VRKQQSVACAIGTLTEVHIKTKNADLRQEVVILGEVAYFLWHATEPAAFRSKAGRAQLIKTISRRLKALAGGSLFNLVRFLDAGGVGHEGVITSTNGEAH
jgi:hypothetical protein